jgi:hypothetical protein
MKSYKVRFVDGKIITVNSGEKLSVKKLSSNFLSFDSSTDSVIKVYLNTNHIVSIEEHKIVKTVKVKKSKVTEDNKEPKVE